MLVPEDEFSELREGWAD